MSRRHKLNRKEGPKETMEDKPEVEKSEVRVTTVVTMTQLEMLNKLTTKFRSPGYSHTIKLLIEDGYKLLIDGQGVKV